MPLGTISGITKDWSSGEISGAKSAGQFFTPSTPAPTTNISMPVTTPVGNLGNNFSAVGALTGTNVGNLGSSYSVSQNSKPPTTSTSGTIFGGASPTPSANPSYLQPQQAQPQQPQNWNDMLASLANMINSKLPAYTSPYNDALTNQLNKIMQIKSFSYTPENDAALQQAQKEAQNLAIKDMARRGRAFDPYASVKMQEAAQGLIPSYQKLAMEQFNTDNQNLYNQLAAIQGLDKMGYDRTKDSAQNYLNAINYAGQNINNQESRRIQDETNALSKQNEAIKNAETKRNNIATLNETINKNAYDIADKEAQRTGWYIDPNVRQRLSTPIPDEYRPLLQQYSNDYAGAIKNMRMEINKGINVDFNNAMIPLLEAARYQKVMSDPQLRAMYMSDYYTQTMEGAKNNADLLSKMYDTQIKSVEAQIAINTQGDKQEKLKQEVNKLKQEIAKGDLDNQEVQARINEINTRAGLLPYQAETQRISANASATSAGASAQNAITNAARLGMEQKKLNSDNSASIMANQFASSGEKDMNKWLNSPAVLNGETQQVNGKVLYNKDLIQGKFDKFVGILKDMGVYSSKDKLSDIIKMYANEQFKSYHKYSNGGN